MPDTLTTKPKRYNYFIGIDISRNELDYAVVQDKKLLFHREAKNEPRDIDSFLLELKSLPKFAVSKAVFCMEHTGIYCNHLLNSLKKIKANVVVENALQIKNSHGLIRGKYDKIDSIRIAQYAEKNRDDLRLWIPRRPILIQLATLFSLRNRVLSLQGALKTPLQEQSVFLKKGMQKESAQLCKKSIDAIKSDLTGIDSRIDEIINADEKLDRLMTIITSVPHVGRITAIEIITSTNEFRDINSPKKFACYAGVAPFIKESGLFKGRAQVSKIANKKMKSLLHLCAMGALRYDADLKAYYVRKTQVEGKAKMAVINAIRNKIILRVFACVNQDRLFQKTYTSPNELQEVNDEGTEAEVLQKE